VCSLTGGGMGYSYTGNVVSRTTLQTEANHVPNVKLSCPPKQDDCTQTAYGEWYLAYTNYTQR